MWLKLETLEKWGSKRSQEMLMGEGREPSYNHAATRLVKKLYSAQKSNIGKRRMSFLRVKVRVWMKSERDGGGLWKDVLCTRSQKQLAKFGH